MGRQCDVAEPSVASVKSWLASNSRRWLVIIDNADESERDYSQYIPSGVSGDVLFTTRVPECEEYNTVGSEKLEDLEPELARVLLYRATNIAESQWKEKEEAAMAILKILGSHTLAIIQAGAFIKKGLCSLEQYPTVFKHQQGKLLKFHANQNLSTYGNVYATFEVSAEYLQKSALPEASDALDLLHIIAFMHNSGISEMVFQRASNYASELRDSEPSEDKESLLLSASHTARLPEYVQGWTGVQDRIRWRRACTVLENLSLVTLNKNDESFAISMHSLIHAWAKERQDRYSRCKAWQAAATIVALSCEGHWDYQPFFTALQAHVRACVDPEMEDYTRTLSDMEAAQLYFQFSYVLYRMHDYRSLDPLVKRIRLRLQDKLENDHRVALEIQRLTGRMYVGQRKLGEAVVVFQNIVERQSRVFLDDDALLLGLQHDLAVAYRVNRQIDKAIPLLEHLLKAQERSLPNHPDKLALQHDLAQSYRENGQISESIQLLEYVVKIQETRLAEDHPDRLTSQHELAHVYQKNGQHTKAIALLEHVVDVRKTSLAKDHPDQLTSQYMLAICYSNIRQYTKAIALLEHVVDVQKTSLANDHPNRLASQHELARVYRTIGQYTKAIALLEHVVDVRKTSSAKDHPNLLGSQHLLACAYQNIGQFSEAIVLLEHVVDVRKTSLAEDHPHLLGSQHSLALFYSDMEQYSKAIALLEHVVGVEKTSLAKDDPERLISRDALASVYRKNGQFDEALRVEEMSNSDVETEASSQDGRD